ncbi:hypothetical protein GCM10010363_19030 [Streptomyces omiyaensis]|nr:hypothetical protein GCM10010363_19030 [Streptomyces omiyaensis]
MALSMTKSSASRAVREALPASDIDGFRQQFGADWQDAVCPSSGARDKSAGYGRRWRPSSPVAECRRVPPVLVDIEVQARVSASRGCRQPLSCDVDKANRRVARVRSTRARATGLVRVSVL